MQNYAEKIRHAERLLQNEEFTSSARECVIAIEQALRSLLDQYLNRVDEDTKNNVLKAVKKRDRRNEGINGLTMGQVVHVLRESKFLEAVEQTLGKDLSSLKVIDLQNLTALRNKFFHEGQKAVQAEAELLLHCLKAILERLELASKGTHRGPEKTILILAVNPKNTSRLRLDEEVREIKQGLQRAKHRDQFLVCSESAVDLRGLRRVLLDYEPYIVHFCGHGEKNGLMVEDETGKAVLVKPDALAGLFSLSKHSIECVVLNACSSEGQAKAIGKYINYVIGMSRGITDKAALEFAIGFYDAIGAGKSFDEAFEFGSNAIDLSNLPEYATPRISKKEKNSQKEGPGKNEKTGQKNGAEQPSNSPNGTTTKPNIELTAGDNAIQIVQSQDVTIKK